MLNKDTLWGSGPQALITPTVGRGLLYVSTNGGNNWGYQLPDTSISIGGYTYISFINKNNGWAYRLSTKQGIHTTTGGDTTIIVNVSQNYSKVPSDFKLLQNYPNPFNPTTKIPFVVKQK